ncbi:MAG TPA: DUF438 domain-containing protein [Anaerolineaceae bacterium]|nr:DUF438 domain-containing protein [Anaerolineaceae bacterium]
MSELINNKQKRVELMKSLIRQLHQGMAEDRVRLQLETLLDEADYNDVFVMEVQLIQEGIPAEVVQDLCDTHTRVLKKHLDLQETPQTTPGHPVHTFVEENRELTKLTAQIRHLMNLVAAKPADEDVSEQMSTIHQLLNNLMDVEKHYRRKENLLFPYFEKNNLPGPPAVMWGKHDEVRELLKTTLEGFQQVTGFTAAEAAAFNQFSVSLVVDAIDDMIYKEEKILFPTALDLLREEDWYDIYLESDENGYCLYAPQFVWTPEGDFQKGKRKSSSMDGSVQMPTGNFKLEELVAMFSTLPFDITFVGKDDSVRYFSPGKDRIFERTRAILGRKVQYCHPPKSVHIVNQIVRDFKEGKQDQARFWINMGGRMIYIVYYAVRNDTGHYLGTLEVTQDVTGIRALEGERRLLAYDAASETNKE